MITALKKNEQKVKSGLQKYANILDAMTFKS